MYFGLCIFRLVSLQCACLKKLVKLECHIECSIASFGSGKTTDSDPLCDEKVRISFKKAKIINVDRVFYFLIGKIKMLIWRIQIQIQGK